MDNLKFKSTLQKNDLKNSYNFNINEEKQNLSTDEDNPNRWRFQRDEDKDFSKKIKNMKKTSKNFHTKSVNY